MEQLLCRVDFHTWLPELFAISPDRTRVAYCDQHGAKWSISVNGVVVADGYDGFVSLAFSRDSQRLAFIAQRGEKQIVAVDGVEGDPYDGVPPPTLTFSPDSKRFAYAALRKDKCYVVVDGVQSKPYDCLEPGSVPCIPIFSEDSNRVAYYAFDHKRGSCIVVDGAEIQMPFEGAGDLHFSPNSQHWALRIQRKGKMLLVIDGHDDVGTSYDGIIHFASVFSPDSQRVAYSAQQGQVHFVVIDNEEVGNYDGVSDILFSPDSKRIAYMAGRNNKYLVVVDGLEGRHYEGIRRDTPIFSPDSRSVAYGAEIGSKWCLVVDDHENQWYERIAAIGDLFSPDSKRLAYAAQRGNKQFAVIDNQEGKPYDKVMRGTPVFSQDSAHVAYGAWMSRYWFAVVDGVEGREYDGVAPGEELVRELTGRGIGVVIESRDYEMIVQPTRPVFLNPRVVSYVAGKGEAVYRIEQLVAGRESISEITTVDEAEAQATTNPGTSQFAAPQGASIALPTRAALATLPRPESVPGNPGVLIARQTHVLAPQRQEDREKRMHVFDVSLSLHGFLFSAILGALFGYAYFDATGAAIGALIGLLSALLGMFQPPLVYTAVALWGYNEYAVGHAGLASFVAFALLTAASFGVYLYAVFLAAYTAKWLTREPALNSIGGSEWIWPSTDVERDKLLRERAIVFLGGLIASAILIGAILLLLLTLFPPVFSLAPVRIDDLTLYWGILIFMGLIAAAEGLGLVRLRDQIARAPATLPRRELAECVSNYVFLRSRWYISASCILLLAVSLVSYTGAVDEQSRVPAEWRPWYSWFAIGNWAILEALWRILLRARKLQLAEEGYTIPDQ